MNVVDVPLLFFAFSGSRRAQLRLDRCRACRAWRVPGVPASRTLGWGSPSPHGEPVAGPPLLQIGSAGVRAGVSVSGSAIPAVPARAHRAQGPAHRYDGQPGDSYQGDEHDTCCSVCSLMFLLLEDPPQTVTLLT